MFLFKVFVFALSAIYIEAAPFPPKLTSIIKSKRFFMIKEGPSPKVIQSVSAAIEKASKECRNVFKWDPWNCPESAFSRKNSVATKEKAYIDALVAASIVHAITKNCSRGDFEDCGCNPTYKEESNDALHQNLSNILGNKINSRPAKDWYWGGCTDDTTYGEYVVKNYLEENQEKNVDPQTFATRHNIKIGREIARKSMVKKCRCHGVSGSCSLQTCWMEMLPIDVLAKELRKGYDKAVRISFEADVGAIAVGNSANHEINTDKLSNRLVYLEKSPNYCHANSTIGVVGTKGRLCLRTHTANSTIHERKSCRNLCRSCGYAVKKVTRQEKFKCNCNFIWCCEVKCDTCVKTVEEFYCE